MATFFLIFVFLPLISTFNSMASSHTFIVIGFNGVFSYNKNFFTHLHTTNSLLYHQIQLLKRANFLTLSNQDRLPFKCKPILIYLLFLKSFIQENCFILLFFNLVKGRLHCFTQSLFFPWVMHLEFYNSRKSVTLIPLSIV